MISAYFVVSRSSGNIIRITRRESPPDDTPTLINVPTTTSGLMRYERFCSLSEGLISLQSVMQPIKADKTTLQNSCRID